MRYSLLKILTLSAPIRIARKFNMTTANTFTFTPPAVDCVPPPIIISTTISSNVCTLKVVMPTLENPAVRGQVALKKALHPFLCSRHSRKSMIPFENNNGHSTRH